MVKDFKELLVWQKSIEFVKEIYMTTKAFPKEELFGLTAQLRRAAVSVSSNIAEGWLRQHTKEYIQFLFHSIGSCGEIETQLIIAKELAYIKDENFKMLIEQINHIVRMLNNLSKSLKKSE